MLTSSRTSSLLARLERVPPWTAAVAGGVGILLFAVLGGAYALARDGGPVPTWYRALPVGLNGEWTLPALYSALLLLFAGLLGFRASAAVARSGRFAPLVALGGLFSFMSLDEVLALHERVENLVDLAWWKVYAPVAVAAGLCVLLVLVRVRDHRLARSALLAGGCCWLVAQAIETQQYDGARLVHRWTILPEEVLEMTGSLMFVLAMLLIARFPWSGGTEQRPLVNA